jgi:hypothetical protein
MTNATRTYEEIRANVAAALARVQQLADDGVVANEPTMSDVAALRDAITSVAANAADHLDELLASIRAGRTAAREPKGDQAHAVASEAAGELRGVLRSLRWPDQVTTSNLPAVFARARDRVRRVEQSLAEDLVPELGLR